MSDSPNKTRALRCRANIRLQDITRHPTVFRGTADLTHEQQVGNTAFSAAGSGSPMNCSKQRAARPCHWLTFAILVLSSANLAQSSAPDLTLTPATLDFKYLAGSALPASQSLQIKSTGTPLDYTLTVTGTVPNYLGQWLSLSTASGTTPGTVKVYVNPYGLSLGGHSVGVVVSAPPAAPPTGRLHA